MSPRKPWIRIDPVCCRDVPSSRRPSRSDPAVSELGFKDFEWKSKRLHQPPAVIANRSVNLNAEAIAKLCMLLQILLNGRVGDMGAECLVVGVDLRPHERLGIVWVLIKVW